MATVKMTFTLDEATTAKLADAAERLAKPKSEVVREAISDYHARIGRLGEEERRRLLADFDRLVPRIPVRPIEATELELKELRRARLAGGRGRVRRPRR